MKEVVNQLLADRPCCMLGPSSTSTWCTASDGGYLWRQKANGQLEKTARSPSRLAQQGLGGCRRHTAVECEDLRLPGVTEQRNGPLGLRDNDGGWFNVCKLITSLNVHGMSSNGLLCPLYPVYTGFIVLQYCVGLINSSSSSSSSSIQIYNKASIKEKFKGRRIVGNNVLGLVTEDGGSYYWIWRTKDVCIRQSYQAGVNEDGNLPYWQNTAENIKSTYRRANDPQIHLPWGWNSSAWSRLSSSEVSAAVRHSTVNSSPSSMYSSPIHWP